VSLFELPDRISGQTRLGRILRLPLRLIPGSAVVRVCSGINKGMKWIVGSSTHGCWLGSYEVDKQMVVGRLVKPGMVAYDIGANAGFYTLAFARLVTERGQVWAFEPLARNIHYLRAHAAMNRLGNVHVVQAAVADEMGLVGLDVTGDGSMGVLGRKNGYLVPTVALDELIDSGALPEPDLIKMDVEGAESMVFEGARRLLARRHVVLLVACHSAKQRELCQTALRANRYRIFYMNGEEHRAPVLDVDEIYAVPQ